jgi:hypothetical protein
VVAGYSQSTALRKIKGFIVTCAAIQQEVVALRTFLKEFWYRPICGCRAEDEFSIVDDLFSVIHHGEDTQEVMVQMLSHGLERGFAEVAKGAERAVIDAKEAKKKANKASKEARNVASATPEAESTATGMNKQGWKQKSAASGADAAVPKAKATRISKVQVAEGRQDIGALGCSRAIS